MADKIQMSLEDIIKSNRKEGRQGGGFRSFTDFSTSKKQGVLKGRDRGGVSKSTNNTRGNVNGKWENDDFGERKHHKAGGSLTVPGKLLVSNLDFGVSNKDIYELFSDFGPLKSASVHYDRSGRSLGTANVLFERKADALKAMKQYNGLPLDGRAIKIQLATSDISQTRQFGGGPPRKYLSRGEESHRTQGGDRSGGRSAARSGNRRAGRGGGGARGKRPRPTIEELDAELDAFMCSR